MSMVVMRPRSNSFAYSTLPVIYDIPFGSGDLCTSQPSTPLSPSASDDLPLLPSTPPKHKVHHCNHHTIHEYYNELNDFAQLGSTSNVNGNCKKAATAGPTASKTPAPTNSIIVDHRRFASVDSALAPPPCGRKRTPSSGTAMVALDFPVTFGTTGGPSSLLGGSMPKFGTLSIPSPNGTSSTTPTATMTSTTRSSRSHEEDIYEDLCYVTLRAGKEREKALGTLHLEPIEKRDYCIKELVETEKNYCEALRMIINHFCTPLSKILRGEDRRMIFNYLKSLADLHSRFYQELYRACQGGTASPCANTLLSGNCSGIISTAASMPSLTTIAHGSPLPSYPCSSSPASSLSSNSSCNSNSNSNSNSTRPPSGSFNNLLYHPSGSCPAKLSACFLQFAEKFLIYGEYCANLPKAQQLLDCLMEDSIISQWVIQCQNRANEGKFKLRDLLSLPMQRILKYHLLLGELIRFTAETHEDFAGLRQAYEAMLDIGAYINEVKRDTESLDIIREVQKRIVDLSMPDNYELKDYGRLIKDGELRVRSNDDPRMRLKSRYVFVFDKVALMCKTLRGTQYSYKEALVLEEFRIEELNSTHAISKLTKNWSNGWSLVHVKTRQTYTFYVKNEELKRKWLEAIERGQDNVRPCDLHRTDHRLSMCTVPVATYCAACSKLLLGTWYQGYQCQVCNVAVHKCCIAVVKSCASMCRKEATVDFTSTTATSTMLRRIGVKPQLDLRGTMNQTTQPALRSPGLMGTAPPTPIRSKRIVAKAIAVNPGGDGQLAFEPEDTIVVFAKQTVAMWYGRNITKDGEGYFGSHLVTELATDSPASSSIDSPTHVLNSSGSSAATGTTFRYEDPFGDGNPFPVQTLPRRFALASQSSTPSPQSVLIPSSPLAASTPAINTATSGNFFFGTNPPGSFAAASTTLNPSKNAEDAKLYYGNGFNLEEYAWFAGSMDRESAQSTIGPLPNGSFMVRISPKQRNNYAISLNYNGGVKHMRVCVTDAPGITPTTVHSNPPAPEVDTKTHFYLSETRYFRTIVDLVRWYELNSLSESFHMVNTQLVLPYKKAYCQEVLGHAVAIFSFTGTSSASQSYLSLRKGDRITVLSRGAEDKGWWKGQIGDRMGYFPLKYATPTTAALKDAQQELTITSITSRTDSNGMVKGVVGLKPSPLVMQGEELVVSSSLSPLTSPNHSLSTQMTEISPDPTKPSPSGSPFSSSSSSSSSTSPSSSSPMTLSSPVNSDSVSLHSRQASSDAGIEIAGFLTDHQPTPDEPSSSSTLTFSP